MYEGSELRIGAPYIFSSSLGNTDEEMEVQSGQWVYLWSYCYLIVEARHRCQSGFFSQYSSVHSSKFSEHVLANKMNPM